VNADSDEGRNGYDEPPSPAHDRRHDDRRSRRFGDWEQRLALVAGLRARLLAGTLRTLLIRGGIFNPSRDGGLAGRAVQSKLVLEFAGLGAPKT
jgi:hypothetical protein